MNRAVLLVWLGGCGGDKSGGDTGTPVDADADTDTDADSDADTDADTDTAPPGPEPTCADAATTPLDEVAFAQLFEAKMCWWWDHTCDQAGSCPPLPPPPKGCTFDADAACACLDGTFTCGPAGPRPDPICSTVYDCPVDTGWWIDTGGSGGSGGGGSGGSG